MFSTRKGIKFFCNKDNKQPQNHLFLSQRSGQQPELRAKKLKERKRPRKTLPKELPKIQD
jgi:hypothetical protein